MQQRRLCAVCKLVHVAKNVTFLCSHPSLSSMTPSRPSTHLHASCRRPRSWTPAFLTPSSVTAPSLRSALWRMPLSVCGLASARMLSSGYALLNPWWCVLHKATQQLHVLLVQLRCGNATGWKCRPSCAQDSALAGTQGCLAVACQGTHTTHLKCTGQIHVIPAVSSTYDHCSLRLLSLILSAKRVYKAAAVVLIGPFACSPTRGTGIRTA